jgi:hypothetical protein
LLGLSEKVNRLIFANESVGFRQNGIGQSYGNDAITLPRMADGFIVGGEDSSV